jgi:hypothetical protein
MSNDWRYFHEFRLNFRGIEIVYWENQTEWNIGCQKLNAIIPVFFNDARFEFVLQSDPEITENLICWHGLGGTLTYNGKSFEAKFPETPSVMVPNKFGGPIKFWKSTRIQGIYKPIY